MKRGDTFIVDEDRFRGSHFTCVGVHDDFFFAGDTNGRMWKFEETIALKYNVRMHGGPTCRDHGRINAEAIIEE